MSLLDTLLGSSGLAGVLGMGSQIGGFFSQLQQQHYMEGVQEKTWEREDNAVQRRVADLKAAGLSPVLAAGAAASSSAPVRVDFAQPPDLSESMQGAAKLATSKQNIATTHAQEVLLGTQNRAAIAAARTKEQEANLAETMYGVNQLKMRLFNEQAQLNLEQQKYNFQWYKDHHFPVGLGGTAAQIAAGADNLNALAPGLGSNIESFGKTGVFPEGTVGAALMEQVGKMFPVLTPGTTNYGSYPDSGALKNALIDQAESGALRNRLKAGK